MESMQNFNDPSFWITVFKSHTDENQWHAMGSRKTTNITIQRQTEFDHYSWDYGYADRLLPIIQDFTFEGRMRGFTFTTGATPLSAVGALLDAFKEEERREEEEARQQKLRYAASEKKRKKALKKMKKAGNSANGLDWDDF